ncbi:MAG: tetratricopeptide repeat protein [Polyangiaceae bacterium]
MSGEKRPPFAVAFGRKGAVIAFFAVALGPSFAHAEDAPKAPVLAAPTAGPTPPRNYPVCVTQPTADDIAVAKKTFELGVRYFNEADYDRAIRYFKDAYQGDCNAHKLLTNIARAYELLGDRAEAVRALEEYLDRSRDAEDTDLVRRRIVKLKAQIDAQPKQVPSPTHGPSGPSRGATRVETEGPKRGSLVPLAMASLGGAAMITGGAMIAAGAAKITEAENACPARKDCPGQVATDGNTGRSIVTGGVVLAGVGALAVGTGVVWYLVGKSSRTPSPRGDLVPQVGPGYAGATYAVTF